MKTLTAGREASRLVRGTRFLRTPGYLRRTKDRTPAGVRGVLDTLSGCGFQSCRSIPGVRKKRVPLAKFPAPLRGAKCPNFSDFSAEVWCPGWRILKSDQFYIPNSQFSSEQERVWECARVLYGQQGLLSALALPLG